MKVLRPEEHSARARKSWEMILENVHIDALRETVAPPELERPAQRDGALIDAILSRKSVSPKHLTPPGPSESDIALMLESALSAPDHGNLRAWRAVLVPQARREELAKLFRAAKLEQCPGCSPEDLDKAGQKALNGPVLLAILLSPVEDHAQVTVEEQYIGLGAALQNMLLTAHLLGYGAMITSGHKVRSRALRKAFIGAANEKLVAFITVGTQAIGRHPRQRIPDKPFLSHW